MNRYIFYFRNLVLTLLVFTFTNSCSPSSDRTTTTESNGSAATRPAEPGLTVELRDAMTPEQVLQAFKDGNKRFVDGDLRYRKFTTEISETAITQNPYAIVLSCIDSRAPAETIFDKRLGDIFNTRLAGNVLNEDVLGGMEFACNLAGAKLIMVMGHTKCGAIKGAAANVEFGNLTHLLNKIEPAIASANTTYSGTPDADNYKYVDHVAEENVKYVIDQIRARSPELEKLEREGKIKIVGSLYEIETGVVRFYEL
ncbi:MAG: carbonic anhydrase family protein [Bacteroidia bacterium]